MLVDWSLAYQEPISPRFSDMLIDLPLCVQVVVQYMLMLEGITTNISRMLKSARHPSKHLTEMNSFVLYNTSMR